MVDCSLLSVSHDFSFMSRNSHGVAGVALLGGEEQAH